MPAGATATDMVLRVVEILRQKASSASSSSSSATGMNDMSVADRATIANMAPEYGATMGFFPVDDVTLEYLRQTGRTSEQVELGRTLRKEQGLFRTDDGPELNYTKRLSLDLGTVEPSSGRPETSARSRRAEGHEAIVQRVTDRARSARPASGFRRKHSHRVATVKDNGHSSEISHGAVVIAAITSCTNTSNPSVMIGAGLLAKKAVERGLTVAPHVKTSLAPGSRVVTDYLDKAGLTEQPATSSVSTPSAMAARLASATADRFPSRSPRRSSRAIWSPRRCSAATGTSKAGSIR